MLAMFIAFCAMCVVIGFSCNTVTSVGASGTVTASPGGEISATIGVVITFAQAADVAAQTAVAADAQLTTAQQMAIHQALLIGIDTLHVASEALADYQRVGDAPSQCRLVDALQATVAARVNILQLLSDAGVPIPPMASAAVEGVAALVTALTPVCPSDAGNALAALHAHLRALR
jgi:hypothetical protein